MAQGTGETMAKSKQPRPELAAQEQPEGVGLRLYLPFQVYLLDRLEGLMARKQAYDTDPRREEWVARALDRAIYVTLVDCIQQGVGEEARAILRREHHRSRN